MINEPISWAVSRKTRRQQMELPNAGTLNQIGLLFGILGAFLLVFSSKTGVISKDGNIIFDGLDPMDSPDLNVKRVIRSHWRNKYFTPIGLVSLFLSFFLQLAATFIK